MLLRLPSDTFQNILSYNNDRDLVVIVTLISQQLSAANKDVIDFVLRQVLSKKWDVPMNILSSDLQLDGDLHTYIPHARSIISGVITEDTTVICDSMNNTASFCGLVGESNRSVQCAYPLPSFASVMRKKTMAYSFISCLQYFSCSKASKIADMKWDTEHQFSMPFAYVINNSPAQLCFDLRSVFYYEIQIISNIESSNSIAPAGAAEVNNAPARSDCVAVGLATKFFLKDRRFPGWDNESFGYHGDDGAIFHGRGRQLDTYGPKFGLNDTVGCGLNYNNMSIFFTLNGKNLGAAFKDIKFNRPDIDLYPTVGIDAPCTVKFNYGKTPFQFDLLDYISRN
jgi:hypothetical protein